MLSSDIHQLHIAVIALHSANNRDQFMKTSNQSQCDKNLHFHSQMGALSFTATFKFFDHLSICHLDDKDSAQKGKAN